MDMKEYFEKTKGTGVLSTAGKDGRVDAALYARPHVIADGEVAFIMADKLSHVNLQENPFAAYLFKEEGPGHQGKRLFLKKIRESASADEVAALRTSYHPSCSLDEKITKYAVYFKVEKELPLVGSGNKETKGCCSC